eukprot:UN03546
MEDVIKRSILHDISRYNSVDTTDIDEYDPSHLTPTSKMVLEQWKMDETDDLLIDGYYRESNLSRANELSFDIKKIIISFYLKQYSKGTLKRKMLRSKELYEYNRQLRIEKCIRIFWICLATLLLFGFVFGSDIATLIIAHKNDCDATIDGDNKYAALMKKTETKK